MEQQEQLVVQGKVFLASRNTTLLLQVQVVLLHQLLGGQLLFNLLRQLTNIYGIMRLSLTLITHDILEHLVLLVRTERKERKVWQVKMPIRSS